MIRSGLGHSQHGSREHSTSRIWRVLNLSVIYWSTGLPSVQYSCCMTISSCVSTPLARSTVEAPYDALRLEDRVPEPHGLNCHPLACEELQLSSVTCDCSSRGNAFCIIFRQGPGIYYWPQALSDFELDLLGLPQAQEGCLGGRWRHGMFNSGQI